MKIFGRFYFSSTYSSNDVCVMRLASLFTGGKDSTYATQLAIESGDDVNYLVTMQPKREDSWMFHSINIHLSWLVAKAIGIDHIAKETGGEKERELEDLKQALSHLNVDGVVSGAITSNYQRKRINHICEDLGIEHRTPLWGRDGRRLLEEMLSAGLSIIVTSVAALGLTKRWLGRNLDADAVDELTELNRRYGVDICGEGGEMETLVQDAPWFRKRLEITRAKSVWNGIRGSYKVVEATLRPKAPIHKG